MDTAQNLPPITERTFAVVQDMMSREGLDTSDSAQVALYVEKLIARERFFRTAGRVREQLADLEADQLEAMIDEAVEEEKASRREKTPGADRS